MMRLHGREAELQAIDAVLAAAEGFGSLVIVGEAGIGKSALLEAAAERAAGRGMHVIQGRAAEHEQEVPFGLAIDALDEEAARVHPSRLKAAGDDLAAVLPSAGGAPPADAGPGERFRYHRALTAFVELLARQTPTALVLDDLQWADAASLEWVLHMLRRPPHARGLLLLATRPGDTASRVLGSGEHLILEPLARDAAQAMLADIGAPPEIADEAEGNPLFLRELARASRAKGEVPATIAAAVRQEVDRLDPTQRALLEGAAAAGDPFDPELAATAAALDQPEAGEALDALAAAGLVTNATGGATFTFRHPLVRRAVYDASPPAWRLAAHERLAELLERRRAPDGARAYHVERYALAGDEAAIRLLERAARADAQASPATAAHWYRAVLRLLPSDAEAHQRRACLLVPFGQALAATGQLTEALEAFDEAMAHEPSPQLAAEAARAERELGHVASARARLERALPNTVGRARVALELELVAITHALGDVPAMVQHARDAAAHSREGAPAALAMEAFAAAWSSAGERELVAKAQRQMLALPPDAPPASLDWAGSLCFSWERFGPAAVLLDRAVTAAVQSRRDQTLPRLRGTLALALLYDLQPRPALEQAEAAEDGARLHRSLVQIGSALSVRAMVLDLLGRPVEAEASAAEANDILDQGEPTLLTATARVLNLLVMDETDPERLLSEVLPMVDAQPELLARVTSLLRPIVTAAVATGRAADAQTWIAAAEEGAFLPGARVRVACAKADLLPPEQAEPIVRDAVALAEAESMRLDAARARIVLGRVTGDTAELERVLAEAKQAGAGRLVAEAARELRRLGVRTAATAPAAGGDELTERERSIAELVAEGRSNKQVAAALFLSGKTVENNLSRIYAKLGVRSRTELARRLRDAG